MNKPLLTLHEVVYQAISIYSQADACFDIDARPITFMEADNMVDKLARENGFSLKQVQQRMDEMVPF